MNDFNKKIRLGTRASNLALSQVSEIHLLIAEFFPEIKIEVIPIVTSGDKIQDKNLAEIGGKGLFIKELEEALINNKIDIAVHSSKDIPPIIHQDTEISAFTVRKSFEAFRFFRSFSVEAFP
jgi:hydroxymethylbilane synthase